MVGRGASAAAPPVIYSPEEALWFSRGWNEAYDAGYVTGWIRGFLTALAVAVISLVLLVLL